MTPNKGDNPNDKGKGIERGTCRPTYENREATVVNETACKIDKPPLKAGSAQPSPHPLGMVNVGDMGHCLQRYCGITYRGKGDKVCIERARNGTGSGICPCHARGKRVPQTQKKIIK